MFWLAQIVFWTSALALIYTYVGYPLLVFAVSRARPLPIHKADFEPTFSVIITAYNEEADLAAKLENTLRLEYPAEKLEILVASDGSTDRTDDIAREFARRAVKLLRVEGRVGKTETQNQAVARTTGEIILFSDATTVYRPDTLRVIAPNFADKTVGCAAGKLVYVDPHSTTIGSGARSYWNYETFLKQSESAACSLIGVSGCLYAVRRAAYVPMYREACSDFLIATKIREQNLRTIFEPNAVSIEETNRRADKELNMRVRVINQSLTDLWRHRRMLNPFTSGFFAVELLSHKVLRYCLPLFLLLIFAASLLLAIEGNWFFAALTLLQIIFYAVGAAAIGFDSRGFQVPRLLSLPQYFLLVNAAIVLAFLKFARGERIAVWQPVRENNRQSEEFNG